MVKTKTDAQKNNLEGKLARFQTGCRFTLDNLTMIFDLVLLKFVNPSTMALSEKKGDHFLTLMISSDWRFYKTDMGRAKILW